MSTTQSHPDKLVVGLHFRRYPEVGANTYDNALLVKALGLLGVETVLIPNISAYDFDSSSVLAHPLELGKDPQYPGSPYIKVGEQLEEHALGPDGITAVRARVGIGQEIESLAAVVNDTNTRELGIDKWAQYKLAGDFMPATRLLSPGEEVTSELLDQIPGDKVVIKRSGGSFGRWVTICDKSTTSQAVQEMRQRIEEKAAEGEVLRRDLLIQEFVPASKIEGLHPADDQEYEFYKNWGPRGHELRFYSYMQAGSRQYEYSVALRAMNEDNDGDWIFIDQDKLPEGAVLLAQQISDRFITETGSKGAFIAVDLFQGQRAGDDEPRWLVREINAKDPIMAKSARSFGEAYMQRAKLGQLLADLAQNEKRGL